MKYISLSLSLLLLTSCQTMSVEEKAKIIHKQIITLDTHVDFDPKNMTLTKNYGMKLKDTQVDIHKMNEGGLDAAFFIVYVGQGTRNLNGYRIAYGKAMKKFNAIHRMTGSLNKDKIALAKNTRDVEKIWKSGKKVAMIGVENAYPIGTDFSKLKKFYDLGARYISLTHNGHSQFGDSNVPRGFEKPEIFGGVSPLGKKLIQESNKLGIMLDISHASKKTALDTIRLSRAPVIASHSGAFSIYAHPRNVHDETLEALKKNKGVIQIVAFRSYLAAPNKVTLRLYNELAMEFGLPPGNPWNSGREIWNQFNKLPARKKTEYWEKLTSIGKKHYHTSIKELVDHIDYVSKKIGIDHVGISSDFGGGGGIRGWENATTTLNVTIELVRRGYTKDQIQQIWSGNLLRVWSDVEKISKTL